jgi:serine/threonine-protein kinase RsbT
MPTSEVLRRIFINNEMDVAVARLQAREVAKELGFGTVDQARISLATSELARNMSAALLQRGEVRVSRLERDQRQGLLVEYVQEVAPSVARVSLPDLVGVTHLVDECAIQHGANTGTLVTLIKWQPAA